MTSESSAFHTTKPQSARAQFERDITQGLRLPRKELPSKYLYDQKGSQLFDEICELEEYYPTRTELAIMEQHGEEMAQVLGEGCLLIEYGSGSSLKTRLLLDRVAPHLAAYVPVDISREHLHQAARQIEDRYPDLEVLPVAADFTGSFAIPEPSSEVTHRVVYFPGSTIGNFAPDAGLRLLQNIARVCGPGGGLLLGLDLKKDVEILEAAYDDAKGVTAEFIRNILHRMNRELGADFDVDAFRYQAKWNPELSCVEMRLLSTKTQKVHLGESTVAIGEGESILVERSFKYDVEMARQWVAPVGFQIEKVWTDSHSLFSVLYLSLPGS